MGIPDCGTTMNEKHAPCSVGACAAIVSFIDWNAVAAQAPPLHTISRYSTAFHSKYVQACEGIFRHTKAKARRLAGGKSRGFNAGMAKKAPQDCIGLG